MNVRDLIPWGRDTSSNQAPAVYREEDRNPLPGNVAPEMRISSLRSAFIPYKCAQRLATTVTRRDSKITGRAARRGRSRTGLSTSRPDVIARS